MSLAYCLVSILEVALIWIVLNYLLKFLWGTRAMDVVFGLLMFLCLFILAGILNLPVIRKLMLHVVNVAAVVVFIIFQPEIRLALSRIRFRKKHFMIDSREQFIEHLATCIFRLSERQIGALVVMENQDVLDEFLGSSSVQIHAQFSEELLESIFDPTSPLHDGAVVIRDDTIAYARVILPLAQDTSQLSRTMGTRHRAALGISQKTDALVITVSEETGCVSLSREGILTRGVKLDRFKAVLNSLLNPNKKRSSNFLTTWLSSK